jgi:hypothetical protein
MFSCGAISSQRHKFGEAVNSACGASLIRHPNLSLVSSHELQDREVHRATWIAHID